MVGGRCLRSLQEGTGINLQSCNCNELLGSRLPSEPRGVSSITARQSWGPARPISALARPLQWHFQTPGLPVPTEMTNTVTKEESQAQHPQSIWCRNCCYDSSGRTTRTLKRILRLQHAGLPERDSWAVRALTSPVASVWSPGPTDRSQQDPGRESNKKKLRPFNSNILAKGIGDSPSPPSILCGTYTN